MLLLMLLPIALLTKWQGMEIDDEASLSQAFSTFLPAPGPSSECCCYCAPFD